jgi:prepilin-type processing-associated H-X9-DG protein
MKTPASKFSPGWPSRAARRFKIGPAFTLIELLVVVGTMSVLSALLLPALAGTRAQSKVTACADNFRQWAVSVNLYAADNHDSLPSFYWGNGGGTYLWDVSPMMVSNMAPYGLTVPMWFDPVRPNEFDMVQKRLGQVLPGRQLVTLTDLSLAFAANSYSEGILEHNWWVPRNGFPPQPNFSTVAGRNAEPFWMKGTPVGNYGYPYRLHSNAATHVPFISCKACSSIETTAGSGAGGLLANIVPPASGIASSNPTNTCPNTAHFVNGVLQGVNAAYADGHVESHTQATMLCGYATGGGGDPYWFY